MTAQALVAIEKSDSVVTLRLNKPRRLNALCASMSSELLEALGELAQDDEVRALLLTGTGRAFCAGSDLTADLPEHVTSPSQRGDLLLSRYFNPLLRAIHGFPKPVVVGVNGMAVGGGVGLALSGDIVIASSAAEFRLNFVPKLGLVPDLGCTWWLPSMVGRARALGLALTGKPFTPEQARDWGLIWGVAPELEFEEEAMRLARRLASAPSEAIVATRFLMDEASGRSMTSHLDCERVAQVDLMNGPEFAEGMRAFTEKREPESSKGATP